ncbi:EpsG family protein [Phocaeicola sp.]
MALFIPSFFSGCRDLEVGYDVLYYEYGIFQDAVYASSFMELFLFNISIEPAFLLINYIASFFTGNLHVALGTITFVTLLFAYLAMVRFMKEIPLWIFFLTFLLYYYANSLNLIRQSVAVSITLYAFAILRTSGLGLRFYVVSLLAFLSHYSAIIPWSVYLLYAYISRLSEKRMRWVVNGIIIVAIVIFVLFPKAISLFSVAIGKDYTVYATGDSVADWAKPSLSYTRILFCLVCLYLTSFIRKYRLADNSEVYKCKTMIFIFLFCLLLGKYTGSAGRLALYYMDIMIFYLLYCANNRKWAHTQRKMFNFIIIALFIFFYYKFFYAGLEYKSKILGLSFL